VAIVAAAVLCMIIAEGMLAAVATTAEAMVVAMVVVTTVEPDSQYKTARQPNSQTPRQPEKEREMRDSCCCYC
jgi:hypothetical protein